MESDQVKAVISIGCCYNLLSEDATGNAPSLSGFPMSQCVKSDGFALGRSARDLACQVHTCRYVFIIDLFLNVSLENT